MPDTDSSVYDADVQAKLAQWSSDHLSSYINSGGVEGHIMDMRFLGGYRYEPMLLIRYVGRKTGKTMIAGLGYAQYGSEIVIVASKGGADTHPQWYLNIVAGGPLAFQVATQAFNATWREPKYFEKEEVWSYVIKSNPLFAEYRKRSQRDIPLLLLTPHEQIPVFRNETG